jgi:guanylate kinase
LFIIVIIAVISTVETKDYWFGVADEHIALVDAENLLEYIKVAGESS